MVRIKTELEIQRRIQELSKNKIHVSNKEEADLVQSQIDVLQWVLLSSKKQVLTSEELKKYSFNLELG